MKRNRPAAYRGSATPSPTYKTSAPARALTRRCTRAPTALRHRQRRPRTVLVRESQWRSSSASKLEKPAVGELFELADAQRGDGMERSPTALQNARQQRDRPRT